MVVEIDSRSGFCHGVVTAIRKAEEQLEGRSTLFCLGDIVHNSREVDRLKTKGLRIITHADLPTLTAGSKVLLRAHGEPPATYDAAIERGIEIIDATCPVVLRLQQRIKESYACQPAPQIVIYGKKGHAEVNGLVGQTNGDAIVVENTDQLDSLDYTRPIVLYSQTTKSLTGFDEIRRQISSRMAPGVSFESYDTICRQVANRVEQLQRFAAAHSLVLFVAGAKSSNGKVLYANCREVNPNTRLISGPDEFDPAWVEGIESIGICGATSTPRWLMEEVRDHVMEIVNKE